MLRLLMLLCLTVGSAILVGLTYSDTSSGHTSSLETLLRHPRYFIRNALLGPVRVGIQVGHEHAHEHPEELANLRWSTGGFAHGVNEVDINREVAQHLKIMLEPHGIIVDILPATTPVAYRADLFLSLHADSVSDQTRHGYKSAVFEPYRNDTDPLLKNLIDEAYFAHTPMADDHLNVSANMFQNYSFNHQRFLHSIHPDTPGILVEMGYISNQSDLAYLQQTDQPALAIYQGVMAFLKAQGRILN